MVGKNGIARKDCHAPCQPKHRDNRENVKKAFAAETWRGQDGTGPVAS